MPRSYIGCQEMQAGKEWSSRDGSFLGLGSYFDNLILEFCIEYIYMRSVLSYLLIVLKLSSHSDLVASFPPLPSCTTSNTGRPSRYKRA